MTQPADPANDIDAIYRRIRSVSEQLDELPEGAERRRLERERERLRAQARSLAGHGRHPASVALEIEAIERRLSEIERLKIGASGAERRPGLRIQDASAYRSNINQRLDAEHAAEVAELTSRLEVLRSVTSQDGPS